MRKTWGLTDRFDAMRRALVWAAQIGMFALSGVAAFLLRFDLSLPLAFRRHLVYALPIWILVKIAVFHVAKLDRGLWRYLSVGDLSRIAYGNLTASVVSCILIKVIAPQGFPRGRSGYIRGDHRCMWPAFGGQIQFGCSRVGGICPLFSACFLPSSLSLLSGLLMTSSVFVPG